MNKLNNFSNFSWLKPNKTKYEFAGIGVSNRAQVALCGMKWASFNNKTVRILYFSYNENLEQDKNFCEHILKIENMSK